MLLLLYSESISNTSLGFREDNQEDSGGDLLLLLSWQGDKELDVLTKDVHGSAEPNTAHRKVDSPCGERTARVEQDMWGPVAHNQCNYLLPSVAELLLHAKDIVVSGLGEGDEGVALSLEVHLHLYLC